MFLKESIRSDAAENTEGLKIVYDDVAPYTKEHSSPQVIQSGLRPRKVLYPGNGLVPQKTVVQKAFPELKRDDLIYPGYSFAGVR